MSRKDTGRSFNSPTLLADWLPVTLDEFPKSKRSQKSRKGSVWPNSLNIPALTQEKEGKEQQNRSTS